ncbi:serine/threonine-protein kinase rio1 [Niveomyces insectorum RCEF 264]|uniref:Serine/threonine-protein kinase RIO1 n=1 Tax=Niveomyces insectorum RCEF 264 TaxID=1081102 RepID=A0A167P2Q7_9HYPO|nr:serine/threonine-protein kinase rio1 [Niveomyces insectorum RCEF 264]
MATTTDDGVQSLANNVANVHIHDGGSGTGNKDGRGKGHQGGREKSDRATRDQVLDQRTEMVLLQMINKGLISELQGVISTGKEANVYAAVLQPPIGGGDGENGENGEDGEDSDGNNVRPIYRAAKVYKTSILSFVDRERYIAGEHRFRHGDHKGNNRKMVKKWAEKEFRNLQRLHRAGIPCPYPIQLKVNVLLMSFLGDVRGRAYPRLRDVELQPDASSGGGGGGDNDDKQDDASVARQWRALYVQLLGLMRRLYRVCRLVHADLSEYNLLYHDRTLYVIDVSQSVGHDHPQTYDFLRMDIRNVSSFFRRKGVDTLRDRAVFEYVTAAAGPVEGSALAEAVEALYAQRAATATVAPGSDEALAELEADNEVFRNEYIPQSLQQVYDIEMVAQGSGPLGGGGGNGNGSTGLDGAEHNLYRNLLADKPKNKDTKAHGENEEDGDEDADEGTSDSASTGSGVSLDNSDNDEFGRPQPRGKRFEDKDVKRAHKQAIKEEKRQKRQTKMPKKVKKKLVSMSSKKT